MACCNSCCDRLVDWVCGPSPFDDDTNAGDVATIIKVSIVGLLFIALCTVGYYYSTMGDFQWFNPFNLSLETQMGFSIAGSCIFGTIAVIGTVLSLIKPVTNLYERNH
jgi:hypothetical protein